MHYTIAICDDELVQREYLSAVLEKWKDQNGHTLSVFTFESAEAFQFDYAVHKAYDILLLDIQMKKTDGISLAKSIRRDNEVLQIIFITGFASFIAEGYEVSALHYLVKPVGEEKLFEVLNKAVSRMKTIPQTVLLPKPSGSIKIAIDDILYAEIISHTTILYTTRGKEEFAMRIADMEAILHAAAPNLFLRCHRSYIVSLRYVHRVTKNAVLLENGREIPLSRNLYDQANQAFIKFN